MKSMKGLLAIAMASALAGSYAENKLSNAEAIKISPKRTGWDDHKTTWRHQFGSMKSQKRRRKLMRQNPSLRKRYSKR